MNNYEEKRQARIDRYKGRAIKSREESSNLWDEAQKMGSAIPFGQPILVGHHSEKSDRNYRDRLTRKREKSIESMDKADYWEQRANAAEKNHAISSDDPEAVRKLKEKIAGAERNQELMKAANKIIKKKISNEEKFNELKAIFPSVSELALHKLLEPDFMGRIGFAQFNLSNNNANIRRMKQRLEELERRAGQETKEEDHNGIKLVENVEENRVQIIFPGKPEPEVRAILKQNGFRWSPRNMAWQRHLNNSGRFSAQSVIKQIQAQE